MHLSQFSIGLLLCGLVLTISGFTYRFSSFAKWDARILANIYPKLEKSVDLFRYLWPLGTTPVAIVLISMTVIPNWRSGSMTMLVYIGIALLERVIKMKLNRPRPFNSFPNIKMNQPTQPKDPSHPSGDALRNWFLAILIPVAFNLPWPVRAAVCIFAGFLCLGRIALGVHYPLDVIGGAGLGIFGAGIATIFIQI